MSHPFKRNLAELLRIEFGRCFSLKDFNEKQWKISENVSFTFLHKFLKINFSLISCPCAAIFAFESKYSDRSSTFPTYLRIFGKKIFPRRPVMEWTWGTAKKVAARQADRRCATDRLLTCFWPINSPAHQVQIRPFWLNFLEAKKMKTFSS